MKIGITGGSGFIGRYFVDNLEKKADIEEMRIIDIADPAFSGNFNYIKGDIRDKSKIDEFCKHLDCVIHLAAAHHDFGIADEEYFDVNEYGTDKLLTAMTKYDVNMLIFYSSVAIYGTVGKPADEHIEPNPENPYGSSKLAAEKKIIEWSKKDEKKKAIIIRPTVVIGARNLANMYFLIDQIYKKRYLFHFGNGNNIKSIAYVKNLVDFSIYLLFEKIEKVNQHEIFNYVDYPQMTFKQTISTIHKELGKPEPRVRIPLNFALTISKIFDLIIALTGKNLPISSARIKKTAAQTQFETVRVSEWKFNPQWDTEEGLKDMVKWYLKTKYKES
jgi:nucleoside-diphosphate-sugar epimerase